MSHTQYPHEGLRRKLVKAGIARSRHDVSSMQALLPGTAEQLPCDCADPDTLADVLLFLIEKNIVQIIPALESLVDIDAGQHVCQFYSNVDELLEVQIPYLQTGLDRNELCLWIVSPPLTRQMAYGALRTAVPGLDNVIERQIELIGHANWYLDQSGAMKPWDALFDALVEKGRKALEQGHRALRVASDTGWAAKDSWDALSRYKSEVTSVIKNYPARALTGYSIEGRTTEEMRAIACGHSASIGKRDGHWRCVTPCESEGDDALFPIGAATY